MSPRAAVGGEGGKKKWNQLQYSDYKYPKSLILRPATHSKDNFVGNLLLSAMLYSTLHAIFIFFVAECQIK